MSLHIGVDVAGGLDKTVMLVARVVGGQEVYSYRSTNGMTLITHRIAPDAGNRWVLVEIDIQTGSYHTNRQVSEKDIAFEREMVKQGHLILMFDGENIVVFADNNYFIFYVRDDG